MNDIREIHKARRMLKAIYRLADQPSATSLSDIRFFARAGVIQLNHMLDQASQAIASNEFGLRLARAAGAES